MKTQLFKRFADYPVLVDREILAIMQVENIASCMAPKDSGGSRGLSAAKVPWSVLAIWPEQLNAPFCSIFYAELGTEGVRSVI